MRPFLEAWREAWGLAMKRGWLLPALALLPWLDGFGSSLWVGFLSGNWAWPELPSSGIVGEGVELTEEFRRWAGEEPSAVRIFWISRYIPFSALSWVVLVWCLWGVAIPRGRRWWSSFCPWGWLCPLAILLTTTLPALGIVAAMRIRPTLPMDLFRQYYSFGTANFAWLLPLVIVLALLYVGLICALILPAVFLGLTRWLDRNAARSLPRETWLALFVLPIFGHLVPTAFDLIQWTLRISSAPHPQRLDSVLELVSNAWVWMSVRILLVPMFWIPIEAACGVGSTFLLFLRAPRPALLRVYAWILGFSALSLAARCANGGMGGRVAPLLLAGLLCALSLPALLGLRCLVRGMLRG